MTKIPYIIAASLDNVDKLTLPKAVGVFKTVVFLDGT
jgi:hypothetical protein